MDFFASQDRARRKTKTLIAYFVTAIIGMVAVLYAVAVVAFVMLGEKRGPVSWWQPELLGIVILLVGAIITLGSFYKILELRAGGERIAQMLGGRRLQANSSDPAERRLLNVVEEMALASGIPAPPVFVLDKQKGINAFAAGHTPNDAVIGVNRGTLEILDRDELQGVIAHEFSHILNGDMRLNLRLIGLLHGILLISIIGYYLLRFGGHSGGGKNKGAAGGVVVMGLAMWAIGAVGLLCARMVKSAISRQREYLADASAVQFTRNPDGIGGALKKIGGLSQGSRVDHPEAEVASHMFFASSFRAHFGGLLATHPPLVERIRCIDPAFDGKFPKVSPAARPAEEPPRKSKPRKPGTPLGTILPGQLGERFKLNPVLAMAAIGTVQPRMVEYAARLVAELPDEVREAAHDPFSARAVVFALLLDDDPSIRAAQLDLVGRGEDLPTRTALEALAPLVAECPTEARLPILELLQGTLRSLSPEQYQRFRGTVLALVKADARISLFEFVLQRLLLTHLDRNFTNAKPRRAKYLALNGVLQPAMDLLSVVAWAGHAEDTQAQRAFRAGVAAMGLQAGVALQPRAACSTQMLDQALNEVELSGPMIKKRILAGLFAAAAVDEEITYREAELLRVVADAIECPLPPLVAGSMA